MNIFRLIFITVVFFTTSFLSGATFHRGSNFEPVSQILRGEDSAYYFLKDADGGKWIFKQYVQAEPEDYMDLVYEVLASRIANTLDIPINYVEFISKEDPLVPKILSDEPGTLHLEVPGVSTEEKLPWDHFDLQQKFRSAWMVQKLGSLPPEQKGLRREVIENMAKHPDLPKIVALDTYLGNMDRSLPNIYYDETGDHFYGIDMGNSFKGNLASEALEQLLRMKKEGVAFSDKELEVLDQYRMMLETLSETFPPEVILSQMDEILLQGKLSDLLLNNEGFQNRVKRTNRWMKEFYESTLQLIHELQ